jgi:hypothetical protein
MDPFGLEYDNMAGTKEDVIGILSATEERKLLEN